MNCSPPGSSVHRDSLDKSTGVDCHALLQIFPTQGLNPGLLHCRQILYHLSQPGKNTVKKYKKLNFESAHPESITSYHLLCLLFYHSNSSHFPLLLPEFLLSTLFPYISQSGHWKPKSLISCHFLVLNLKWLPISLRVKANVLPVASKPAVYKLFSLIFNYSLLLSQLHRLPCYHFGYISSPETWL